MSNPWILNKFPVGLLQGVYYKEKIIVDNMTLASCPTPCVMLIPALLIGIFSLSYADIVTSNDTVWDDEGCTEAPSNCTATFQYSFERMLDIHMLSGAHKMNVTLVQYSIDSPYHVCSFDPFETVPVLPGVTVFSIDIQCSKPGTRIVITSNNPQATSLAKLILYLRYCTVYWKDISKIGRTATLKMLVLHDWKDEFASGEPEFFTKCVQLQNSSADTEDGRPIRFIAGMADVKFVRVQSKVVLPISQVFTHYVWPKLLSLAAER